MSGGSHDEPGERRQQGIDASNRDFASYDQVAKDQTYQLSERPGDDPDSIDRFDDDCEIRTCDIEALLRGDGSARDACTGELGAALRDIGFAVLVGHGIERSVFDDAEEAVHRLFTAHSLEQKKAFHASRCGSVNQGYFPLEETTDIHPDLVEGWVFCRRAFAMAGVDPAPRLEDFWPDASYEPVFRRLCEAEERLILPVMRAILADLGCDPHLYDERLTRTNIGLRLNYYPPVATGGRAGRLLGHEDVDLFTFLPAPRSEGLQVLNRRSMAWVRLAAPPGSIILNTGDYMQRISNDVLPSTTHRVSRPRDPEACARARVSFPMNVYLWENEMLEVLPGLGDPHYEPVRALHFHTRTTAKYYGDNYATGGDPVS